MKLALHRKLLLVAILLLLASLIAATGSVAEDTFLTPEVKLNADEQELGADQFGFSLDMSGDRMAVGAAYRDEACPTLPCTNSGAVYLFRYDGNTWVPDETQPKVTASDAAPNDQFGWSIAMDGDTLAVGAPFKNEGAPGSGAVYLFKHDGSTWVPDEQRPKLTAPKPTIFENFGFSIDIADDKLVVGAHGTDTVYVYNREHNGDWVQEIIPLPPPLQPTSLVGYSVAIDEGFLVAGAPDPVFGSSAAYVFDGSDWVPLPAPPEKKFLGGCIDINGDTVVVGSPSSLHPFAPAVDIGSVHVFKLDGGSWVKEDISIPAADGFGSSVTIDGNTLVVGAPFDEVEHPVSKIEVEDAGRAYVFQHKNDEWVLQTQLIAGDPSDPEAEPIQGDRFGWSVVLAGRTVAAGTPFSNVSDGVQVDNAGAAYVYNLPPPEEGPLVEIVSVSTEKEYSLGTAEVGAYPYIDRHYKIKRMSHRLEGSVLVATANDDKWVDAYDHLQLQLNHSAELFVCYDKRGAWRRPSWLREDGWVRTNEYVKTSDWPASPLEVYKKTIEVDGGPVIETLGGNHCGRDTRARSNYFVLVKEPWEDIVTIESVSSDRPYSLAGAVKGARPYIDRPYRIKGIGAGLNGGVLVCTANNDKRLRVEEHLKLRINADAEVFVLYDKRGARCPPDWLKDGWERTHHFIKTSYWPSSPMKVFRKFVKVEEEPVVITLGGNRSGGGKRARCNYFVIVKEPVERILEIVSVSTGKPYSFSTAETCSRPYIDRGYKITKITSELEGGVLLQTANNDKWVSEHNHLVLKSTSPADIYVCYDKRGSDNLPAWLDTPSWTLTDFFVKTTDKPASPLVVLRTNVEAGEITFGGNHSGGDTGARSNYFLIIKQ
jgi:hypothetical protein